VSAIPPLEIQALCKIIDELDYYQILHLEPDATQSDVKRAYFATSRSFHPDANRRLDDAMQRQCMQISKRVTEAYCVLRDPRRRKAYDALRAGPETAASGEADGASASPPVRMQLAEARASHARQDIAARQGKTREGRRFHQQALTALESGDFSGAINHLQMARTFEPDNELFQELLTDVKEKKKAAGA